MPWSINLSTGFNITEDKHGFLWMGTTVRLYSCYDLQKACFVNYMEPEEQDRNYSKLFLASCGDVWLWHPDNGSRRVVHQEDGSLKSTVFKTEAGNLPDNRVNFVREDANGRIWIGTKRGLALVVNGEVKIVNRALHFVSLLANGNTVYFLTEDGDIYSYQEEAQELVRQASISSIAGKTSPTDDFRIKDKWVILTTTGVYNYDPVPDGFIISLPKRGKPNPSSLYLRRSSTILTLNVITSSMTPAESSGFQLMEMGCLPIILPKTNWNILPPALQKTAISIPTFFYL